MLLSLLEQIIDSYFSLVPRLKPEQVSLSEVHLIAHRGAHDTAQGIIENTLAAFRLAEKLGCWGIEFDVQITADQVLVVNHDPCLNRFWGHDRLIANLNFVDLRTHAPDIPTLAEVVAEFGHRLHLFIELKYLVLDPSNLARDLHKLVPGKDYHLLSLNETTFHALPSFPKYCLLLVAVHNNVAKFCQLCLQENYGGLLGHYLLVTNKLLHQLKTAKQLVGVGIVNSKYNLYRELNRKVNYVVTDQAIKMSVYLNSLALSQPPPKD